MRQRRINTELFQEGHVWKEKISDAHIILGRKVGELIPCYYAFVQQERGAVTYKKGDFWCDAHPTALFANFIKII